MGEPEATEGGTQPIERTRGFPAPLPGSMAPVLEEAIPKQSIGRVQQRDKEGIGEAGEEQELLAASPGPDAGTLHGKLAPAVAPDQFQLPSPGIAEHDMPEFLMTRDRLSREQIPGMVARTTPGDDQDRGVGAGEDRDREDSCLDGPMPARVPKHPIVERRVCPGRETRRGGTVRPHQRACSDSANAG